MRVLHSISGKSALFRFIVLLNSMCLAALQCGTGSTSRLKQHNLARIR